MCGCVWVVVGGLRISKIVELRSGRLIGQWFFGGWRVPGAMGSRPPPSHPVQVFLSARLSAFQNPDTSPPPPPPPRPSDSSVPVIRTFLLLHILLPSPSVARKPLRRFRYFPASNPVISPLPPALPIPTFLSPMFPPSRCFFGWRVFLFSPSRRPSISPPRLPHPVQAKPSPSHFILPQIL